MTDDPTPHTRELDLSGLKCPLPVLRTRKFLRRMQSGERLRLTCTDPLTAIDIPHLVRETGDVLEEKRQTGGKFLFVIRRISTDRQAREGPA